MDELDESPDCHSVDTLGSAGYEPPRLEVLGTAAQLTRGSVNGPSDGTGPGNALS